MMFSKRRKRKRSTFYHQIELVYNNPSLKISKDLRKALLESAFLAYRLYPFVCDEILNQKANRNDELIVLQKYLERTRWKYYWGVVLSMAFARQ